MQKLVFMAVMGMTTGFATLSQAQSYLSQGNMSFGKNSKVQAASQTKIDLQDDNAPDKQFSLELKLVTRGSRVEDDNIKSSTSASSVSVDFTWNITSWMATHLDGEYQFASGHAAQIYGAEGSPYTGTGITEGAVIFTPNENFNLAVGLVSTEFNPIVSAFGGDSLAGTRQTLSYKSGLLETSLIAAQAVPTQLGTSNRVLDDQNDAVLTMANFNIGLVGEKTEIRAAYTKYDFYHMTQASAEDSKYLGNTMIGNDSKYAFFKYKFHGQEIALGASTTFRIDDKLSIKGSMIQNDDAPEKRNLGWIAKGSYAYSFGSYKIIPAVTRFRLEPDIIPAFYSIGTYGYLNRDGYSGELRGAFKKYNLETFVRYTDAKEVESKPTQSDRVSYSIGLEVKYEIL